MPSTVVYDANVLYPNSLRDLLIRLAQAALVQAKWSEQILDETFRNLKADRPDLDPAKLDRSRSLMNQAVRDVLVTGHEPLIEVVELPDADDFVLGLIEAHRQEVYGTVQRVADSWSRHRLSTVDDVLNSLERTGLLRSVAALRG